MSRTYRVIVMVLGGLVGGWLGYWLGHWAGWSADADWPWRIGGGTGAILTSIALAVLGVLLAGAALALPSVFVERRLRREGLVGDALILDRWNLGLHVTGFGRRGGARAQYAFLVEIPLPDRTLWVAHATQWLTAAQQAELVPGRHATVRYRASRQGHVVLERAVSRSPAVERPTVTR